MEIKTDYLTLKFGCTGKIEFFFTNSKYNKENRKGNKERERKRKKKKNIKRKIEKKGWKGKKGIEEK